MDVEAGRPGYVSLNLGPVSQSLSLTHSLTPACQQLRATREGTLHILAHLCDGDHQARVACRPVDCLTGLQAQHCGQGLKGHQQG
jgi:hypothetical protein